MTIKKRLFISNILMLAVPVIMVFLSNIIYYIIAYVYFGNSVFEIFRLNRSEEKVFGLDGLSQIFFLPIVGSILIIIFANLFLTRFVFKNIKKPLDVLSEGVQQIKDGNLKYRIDYQNADEFKPICENFNNMAERLSDMVNAQQKDETNRRELIAGISHDLRTPLTSIKAYIEGLDKGVASTPETQKRYLDTIKSKTNDLEYIINQLFLFSKLDIGNFPFRLEKTAIGNELSCFMTNHEKELSEKGLIISLDLDENVGRVYIEIDVVQFRNVIQNILENSVKYNDNEQAEAKIICRKDKDNKNVIIKIADNGPGIPEESIDKLFDVFYRIDASRNNPSKGSGLGLAISKKIVERLKGSIEAENVSARGLAITITLPIIEERE